MRYLFHFRVLLLLAFGLGGQLAAQASHIKGGDIAYRPIASTTAGLPRYHVTVRLFADPTTFDQLYVTLLFTRGNCATPAAGSFRRDNIPRSAILPGNLAGCVSNWLPYQVNLYETDVDLAPGQWTIAFVGENRAANIRNIAGGMSVGINLYLETTLNSTLTTQNASPVFESDMLPILPGMGRPDFSFAAFDADGDSLAYAFTLAQYVPGGLDGTQGGATCGTPIMGSVSPHFALNAFTGALTRSGNATLQGYYVMAARVSEYRRLAGQWELLGYATRDVVYLVIDTDNAPPAFTSASVNGGPAQSLSQPVPAIAGQTVQVTLTAADPDAGQLLRFSSGAPRVVPGLSFTTLSATQARLSWQVPADQAPGRYSVPVAVTDNGCPYSASEDRTLWFTVSASRPLGTRSDAAALASAYPTPFREQVCFAAPAGQAVQVTDALGREVARLQAGPDGLVRWQPAASLPAGLYLARAAGSGTPLARLLRAE